MAASDFDLSVLELPGTSDLNFDHSKHKRSLSKKGSISHRRRPTRATIHSNNNDILFVDSTDKCVSEEESDSSRYQSSENGTHHPDDKVSMGVISYRQRSDRRSIPDLLEGLRQSQVFVKTETDEQPHKLTRDTTSKSTPFLPISPVVTSTTSVNFLSNDSDHKLLRLPYIAQNIPDETLKEMNDLNTADKDVARDESLRYPSSTSAHPPTLLKDDNSLHRISSNKSSSTNIDMALSSLKNSSELSGFSPNVALPPTQFCESMRDTAEPISPVYIKPSRADNFTNDLSVFSSSGEIETFSSHDSAIIITEQKSDSKVNLNSLNVSIPHTLDTKHDYRAMNINKFETNTKRLIFPTKSDKHGYMDSSEPLQENINASDVRVRSELRRSEDRTDHNLFMNVPEFSGLIDKENSKLSDSDSETNKTRSQTMTPTSHPDSSEFTNPDKLSRNTLYVKSTNTRRKSSLPGGTNDMLRENARLLSASVLSRRASAGIISATAVSRRGGVTKSDLNSEGYHPILHSSTVREIKYKESRIYDDDGDNGVQASWKNQISEQKENSSGHIEDEKRQDGLYNSSLSIQLGRKSDKLVDNDLSGDNSTLTEIKFIVRLQSKGGNDNIKLQISERKQGGQDSNV